MNVAQTILDQIRGMDKWALGSWGAKDLVATSNGGLRFKTSGMVKWKGFVSIELNASDLYDVKFQRVRKHEAITDKEVNGVYFDQLVEVIDRKVG